MSRTQTFEACYLEHRASVYSLCMRYGGGSAAWSEDVTHDVFIKLLERLPRLTDVDDVGGWLYRVTTNLCISRLRRERSIFGRVRQRLAASTENAEPTQETRLQDRELAAQAMATLRTLPPREQAVVAMKYLDGKAQREIAETLGLSEGYVSKLLTRALAKIRTDWEVDDA